MRLLSILLTLAGLLTSGLGQLFRNGTPGISGSIDYSHFDTIQGPLVYSILDIVNNMTMPDISFANNSGQLNDNQINVKFRPEDLIMQPRPDINALFFQISNIEIDFYSAKFSYNPPLAPVMRGTLTANVTGADFWVLVEILRVVSPSGRLLPQIRVTNATLNLKPNMMVITFSGGPLLNFAEIIIPAVERVLLNFATNQVRNQLQDALPSRFNNFVLNNDGFVRLGALDPITFPPENAWA